MKTPPPTDAIIIQPLWRKKVARLISRKRPQKSFQHLPGPFQLPQIDPFVGSVRLGNIAGPEQHAWDAALRQNSTVAEIIHASGPVLSRSAQEKLDQLISVICFKRRALEGMRRG